MNNATQVTVGKLLPVVGCRSVAHCVYISVYYIVHILRDTCVPVPGYD